MLFLLVFRGKITFYAHLPDSGSQHGTNFCHCSRSAGSCAGLVSFLAGFARQDRLRKCRRDQSGTLNQRKNKAEARCQITENTNRDHTKSPSSRDAREHRLTKSRPEKMLEEGFRFIFETTRAGRSPVFCFISEQMQNSQSISAYGIARMFNRNL